MISLAPSLALRQNVFFVWVSLSEQKWVISVEPYHLFRYLDEQAYRFNNRKVGDFDRFKMAASQIFGKRLTWNQVTGKQMEPQTRLNSPCLK